MVEHPPDPAVRKSKHRTVYDSLHDELLAGRYSAGGRLPSEAELVERFGASRPTVAKALLELQREGLIERRAGSGTFARAAAEPTAGTFGLIIPELGHAEIFDPVCAAMAQASRAAGFTLLWGDSSPGNVESWGAIAEQLCRGYVERKVAGVFFVPIEFTAETRRVNHHIVAELKRARVPVVLLDRDVEDFPRRSDCDLVGIDNFAAGFELAAHLVDAGARRVHFVARPGSAATVDARIAGCREVLTRRDLTPGGQWVHQGNPADGQFVAGVLRGAGPDAIICANDDTAAVLMRTLIARGVKVPGDVRVAGFDDVRYATLLPVPLTTVRQPTAEIGAAAVQVMLQRLKEPGLPARHITLRAPLVVRESSGQPVS